MERTSETEIFIQNAFKEAMLERSSKGEAVNVRPIKREPSALTNGANWGYEIEPRQNRDPRAISDTLMSIAGEVARELQGKHDIIW